MPKEGTFKSWNDQLGLPSVEEELQKKITEEAAKTEEEQLFVQDVSFQKEEVLSLAKEDVNFLAGIAIPAVFRFMFPPVLLAAWHLLRQLIEEEGKEGRVALGIPRGHGKTTLVKLFILFSILFTKRKFILVVSATASLAENIIADVVDMLNEPNVQHIFGDWKLGLELNRQDLKKFGFRGRPIILVAIGAGGALRGMNLKNERPDVMIFDDIQTKEDAESPVISGALERWMIGTAMKAKSPHGCLFIFCGNMFPTPHCILKKLKYNSSWIKFISGAILADGSALWPQLRPIESLISELDHDIASGHPEIFFSEVLNDTETGINTKVDLAQIKEWKWTLDDKPQGKFIIIDPSSNKLGGDDVAIGYFEVYDGKSGLRKCIEENLSPGNTIRRALLLALQTRTSVIAVESTAYQYSLLYWFGEISKQLGLEGFQFVEVYSGSYSKNSRITDMLKTLTQGELYVHPEVKSLVMNQIVNWNPLRRTNTDGLLDLLAYAPRVMELYGYSIATELSTEAMEASGSIVVDDNHPF